VPDASRSPAGAARMADQPDQTDRTFDLRSPGRLPGPGDTTPHLGPAPQTDHPLPDLDGYEILAEVGRGGMGVGYQARQAALQRVVAVKMILGGAFAGAERAARFRAEAVTIARLRHPNIVQVHEVGEVGGHPYLVLEFVAGGSLAHRVAGKPQPPAWAAGL